MTTLQTTILILDDEPIVSKRLKPSLEKNGYEVETFTRSVDALTRIREKDFDIVVTDLKMEGVNGMEFLTEVKRRSPATEVIVITGFASIRNAVGTIKQGAFDFLPKPFSPRELRAAVEKAMSKTGAGPGNSLDK